MQEIPSPNKGTLLKSWSQGESLKFSKTKPVFISPFFPQEFHSTGAKWLCAWIHHKELPVRCSSSLVLLHVDLQLFTIESTHASPELAREGSLSARLMVNEVGPQLINMKCDLFKYRMCGHRDWRAQNRLLLYWDCPSRCRQQVPKNKNRLVFTLAHVGHVDYIHKFDGCRCGFVYTLPL